MKGEVKVRKVTITDIRLKTVNGKPWVETEFEVKYSVASQADIATIIKNEDIEARIKKTVAKATSAEDIQSMTQDQAIKLLKRALEF